MTMAFNLVGIVAFVFTSAATFASALANEGVEQATLVQHGSQRGQELKERRAALMQELQTLEARAARSLVAITGDEPFTGSTEEGAGNGTETLCLCVFDIDRTLTAGQREHCPASVQNTAKYIYDNAYGGGKLKLSEVASMGISKTACSKCHTGIVSRGDAGGTNSDMRKYILDNVMQTDVVKALVAKGKVQLTWTDLRLQCRGHVASPWVVHSENNCKKYAVEGVLNHYGSMGIKIPRSEVYFFDDHDTNIPEFKDFGFNAFEIGCDTRDLVHTSRCGAVVSEVRLEHQPSGYKMCTHKGR